MNISFEGTENTVRTHSNVDRGTTVYRSLEDTGKVSESNVALDISGTVMDNSAYFGHGRTAEEVMQEAEQQDITARRNYMAVMSNTMSDEDFARLQKEGFHPGSTDIETVVTIVDHIKAALVKGGTEVTGYTDTLKSNELESITGSKAFAEELKKQFDKYDIPFTEENIGAVVSAWHTMEEVPALPEGSVKYMIENEMAPTVENLYLARYSATDDGSRQGKGYYAAGTVAGYFAKKPEDIDYTQLMPQIENVIKEAELTVDDETVEAAKWLIEKGIPLNSDTLTRSMQIKGLQLPKTAEDFLQAVSAAIADGISPGKADITKTQSNLEQAVVIKEQTEQLDEQAADIILTRNLPFTLKNLFAAHEEIKQHNSIFGSEKQPEIQENIQERRLLLEVRLTMTIEANLKLLRRGYQIETAPIEELLEKLKTAKEDLDRSLIQEEDTKAVKEKSSLYRQTLFTVENIRRAPAAVAGDVSKEDTLQTVEAKGKAKEADYKKAGESYEALMTAPRRDMGDSIKKAFRNVDDILADLHREATQENRRAVRILAYNSMEITEENFERIRQADALLTKVTEQMKPGTVLSMIREGINPLTMPLEELENYLKEQKNTASEIESYSRFLYQLEQKNDISSEERSAYIGIYRLLRQIEKGDDAAVGAVLKTGVSNTLENLLSAVRSGRRKQMDYRVDDSFGGIYAKKTTVSSITEQIEKGYIKTREDLEEEMEDEEARKAAAEFDRSVYEEVRNAMGSEEAVLRHLMDYNQSFTADHLMAAGEMLKGFGSVFKNFKKLSYENEEKVFLEETDFTEKLTDKDTAQKAYEKLTEKMQDTVENAAFTGEYKALDMKAMSVLYKQITFMRSMAREENYEMPVEINGSLTAINLKMIHKDGEEGKVVITFETEALGKNAAEFSFTKEGLSGYGICSSAEVGRILSESTELFKEYLAKEEIQAGDIHFITGENLNPEEFSAKESRDRIPGQTPDTLYRAAKAYIGFIQKISKQKGSMDV